MKQITLLCVVLGVVIVLSAPVHAAQLSDGEEPRPVQKGSTGGEDPTAEEASGLWCGAEGEIPCISGGCDPGLWVLGLWCTQYCGGEGEVPCNVGCLDGRYLLGPVCTEYCGGEGEVPCLVGCLGGRYLQGIYCTSFCGHENEYPCNLPLCFSGLAVRLDLKCHASCGGHGEAGCFGIPACDSGHTLNPSNVLYCTRCGSEGEPICLDILDEGFCDPGYSFNPSNVLYCTRCGGQGEPVCLDLFGESVCDPGYSLDPADIRYCTKCGSEGEPICLDIFNNDVCDAGYTFDPNRIGYCTRCGGQDEWICLAGSPICDEGYTLNVDLSDDPFDSFGKCTRCGGEGELLCLNLNYPDTLLCDDDYTLNIDVISDWTNVFGKCTQCGGEGQLVCADPLGLELRCDPNYGADPFGTIPWIYCTECGGHRKPQCSSDPPCDPYHRPYSDPLNLSDPYNLEIKLCEYSGFSQEPTTNSNFTVQPQGGEPGDPVRGIADIHEHQFSNHAFGGAVLWGSVFHEGGVNKALAMCDYTTEFEVVPPTLYGHANEVLDALISPDYRAWDWGWAVHGSNRGYLWPPLPPTQLLFGATSNLARAGDPFAMHGVTGTGDFDGWPHHTDGGHQQMYYMWVKRAYEGGLRLLVNLAVNNEVICEISYQRDGYGCNDMDAVDRQIDQTFALQEYIDDQCRTTQGDDCGWYRVVTSPQQAREVIRAGKMAVVLGIEVDYLFKCRPGDDSRCGDPAWIRDQIALYKSRGIRHVLTMHAFDNAFGGPAIYTDVFSYGNTAANGDAFDTWDCWQYIYTTESGEIIEGGYKYLINPISTLGGLYATLAPLLFQQWPLFTPSIAHCNAIGLRDPGKTLLDELMKQDMIIDIDHMSHRAMEGFRDAGQNWHTGALAIFEDTHDTPRGYTYPPVSSHAGVMPDWDRGDLDERVNSEFNHTASRVKRIKDLGGIISIPAVADSGEWGDANTVYEISDVRERYVNQVKVMGGLRDYTGPVNPPYGPADTAGPYGAKFPGIAMSFDFGGFTARPGPRHLDYPFLALDLECTFPSDDPGCLNQAPMFSEQQTGDKKYDLKEDGMAHYGLLPDLLAHTWLENGEYDEALDPLLNSAETYIRMWERIENCTPDTTAPEITCPPDLVLEAPADASAKANEQPTGKDFFYCGTPTFTPSDVITTGCGENQTIQRTWTATDESGNTASCVQQIVVVDQTVLPNLAFYAAFSSCMNGPDGGSGEPGCDCGDVDQDGDIDMRDYYRFLTVFQP